MDATSLGSGRELAVAAGTLRAALRRATRAAARDGRHPALRAILARQTEDGVTVAAADGFRIVNVALAGAAVRARFAGGEARALLLPVRVADAVMALLEDLGEREAVRFEPAADGRRVSITAGDVRLQAPLGEGTLPDAVQAIPPGWQEWRTRIRVETAALRGALQTVGRASFARIPLLLDPETDQVRYSQRGTDAPKALHGTISAAHEGARQRVALNGEYLLDILEAATGSHVVLSWGDPLKPITIREVAAAGEEGGASVTWAVMPMRAAELEPEYAAA